MAVQYTREHVREHSHVYITITASTNVEVFSVSVGNVINHFNLGSKIVGITSDGGTNLVTRKATLDIASYNKVVFDLEKPMFVMVPCPCPF